ncbi:hypothetical protein HN51_014578 [Arachis hypogaea]
MSGDLKLKTKNSKTFLSIPPLSAFYLPNLSQLTSLLLPPSIRNPIPNPHLPISRKCRSPPSISTRMNSKVSPSNTPPPISMILTPILPPLSPL